MRIKNKTKLIIVTLGLMIAVSTINISNFIVQLNKNESLETQDDLYSKSLKSSTSWILPFIHIDGNIPDNWSNTAGEDWCIGNGTWGNPYIIENVTIDATSSPTGSGILINNSKSEYFIIRNTKVYNAGSGNLLAGVKLENANNGTIINNNCSNNGAKGIFLYNSYNNTISGNTVISNIGRGIDLWSSSNNIISENTVNNQNYGIVLISSCNNNTISGNTVKNNPQEGIYLYIQCDNNTISGNTADNNGNGINVYNYCDNTTISKNTANNNIVTGIILRSSNYNNISGNNVSKDGSNNPSRGIYLWNCSNNIILENCANNIPVSGSFSGIGIFLYISNDNNISGNTANNNEAYGIYLRESSNNNIARNVVNNNTQYGVFLDIPDCDDNNITENYIYFNTLGAIVIGNSYLDHNLIFRNIIVSSDLKFIDDGGSNIILKYNYFGMIPPSIVVDFIAKSISPTEFIFTINVSSQVIGLAVSEFFIQMLWNGTLVPSNNITKLDNGLYKISLTPIFVELDDNPISLNMTFTAAYHNDKYYEINITVEPDSEPVIVPNLLFIEIKDQSFSMEVFNITFHIFNRENQGITGADIQMWWDLVNVSPNIVELENGLYNIMLTPLFTEPGEEPILLNMSVKAIGYPDKYYETKIAVKPDSEPGEDSKVLNMEIVYQLYLMEEFNITFYLYNESSHGIDSGTIQMWWNGINVSSSIQNLGSGVYFVSLEPITVKPGEDPILLEMNISASGYEDKSFETYIAVDPDILFGETGEPTEDSPLIIIIITSTSIAGGIIIIGATAFLLRRRKGLSELLNPKEP